MTLTYTRAYSGFAVNDLQKARAFYSETLGLNVSEANDLLTLHLAGDRDTLIYPKPDFVPATYTILNFEVDDIEKTVDDLTARGVKLERYDGMKQDERGIHKDGERLIAWFTDPAGNVIAVLQQP
jgi:catechol 2,3-dioxygenase-like lactoylglutathione lyase family enzyme